MARLLFLDDDILTLHLMKKMASRIGHDAIATDTPEQAMTAILEMRPDLVLVDMSLKETSGLDFIQSIRQREEYKSLPMVIVSAGTSLEDESQALQAGASGFILKPLSLDILTKTVERFCSS